GEYELRVLDLPPQVVAKDRRHVFAQDCWPFGIASWNEGRTSVTMLLSYGAAGVEAIVCRESARNIRTREVLVKAAPSDVLAAGPSAVDTVSGCAIASDKHVANGITEAACCYFFLLSVGAMTLLIIAIRKTNFCKSGAAK
ncbi:MAG: hypothetical protein KDA89_15225, partial [Planctomycetaceae bacterium]|nr:hypothetical protein [Planctomycetaceae bacterium]